MARTEDQTSVNLNLLRDTLFTFVARAGKGKDEVLQTLARETGAAVAALLKQPFAEFWTDLAQNHRLQVTLELVPKSANRSANKAPNKAIRKKNAQKSVKNSVSQSTSDI